jgi:hypothetical protein
MRALKWPRADHIEAHAVVSSSGEPEIMDDRKLHPIKCAAPPINQFRCNFSEASKTAQDMAALAPSSMQRIGLHIYDS